MAKLCDVVFVSALLVCLCCSCFGLHVVEGDREGVAVHDGVPEVGISSAYQLSVLSMCTVGLNLFEFIRDYNGYGCWCGSGGSGNPVDATDICCHTHDNCYVETQCSSLLWYTIPYRYSKSGCGTTSASITCTSASRYPWWYVGEECAEKLCNCDRVVAECFKTNRATYNPAYRSYNNC